MSTKTFARVAMIAAIYTVLTLCLAPISFGNFQIRISEALTMLPLIYSAKYYRCHPGMFPQQPDRSYDGNESNRHA
jgi:uncharacterized membrane protein